jgi:N-acetylglucosaminyldiphosphoundecaprenol N-acetyl-beta-D-mannosaminyltransferase
MVNQFLPLLVFSTVFERFNVFVPQFDFSLKLFLILLPIVGLILLWKRRLVFNPTFLFPFLVLVILAEVVSIPLSYDPFQSFQVVIFHLLMIGLFYLIVWSVRNERGLTSLVWAWGAGAVVVSVLGFWQFGRFLLGQDPTLFLDGLLGAKTLVATTFTQQFLDYTFLRPSSTFTDVNTAASFVGVFLLLGWGWWLSLGNRRSADSNSRVRTQRLLLCGALVVSFIFFVLASSRSAALGLGVGATLFGFLILREKISKKLLVGGLVLLLSGLVGGLAYLSLTDVARLGSVQERLVYARATVKMLKRTSYAGVGAGNFEPYFTEVIRPYAKTGYSHSIFLTWLGELGIWGVVSNLLLIGVVIFFLWRVLFKLQYNSLWYKRSSALLAGFVALVFSNIFHAHYGLEFTWVLLGLVVGGYYLAKNEKWQAVNEELNILGVRVDNVTMSEAINKVRGFFKSGKKAYIVTPNSEMIVQARKDPEFAEVLNGADLAVPDTAGLVWASRIWGTPLKEWVAGVDLFVELCAEAARRGGRVFLLGADPGVAGKTARALRKRYPKLKVAGTFAGDGSSKGDRETVAEVKRGSKGEDIDLLFVAYGHGKQERWIKRNLTKVPVKVAVGVGGSFDYVSGAVVRAPKLFGRLGLEWLYRLVRQPWRIKRQVALLSFIFLTFREALRQ